MTSPSQEATHLVVRPPMLPTGSPRLYRSVSVARLLRRGLGSTAVELAGAIASDPAILDRPGVAIVGARAASRPACELAFELGRAVADADRGVISGGALGIDGAAHEGALRADGRTIAVMGTGIDVSYPQRHVDLFNRMLPRGGWLSPFARGAGPRRSHFPSRNRYIAALADAVVVVEASLRSGSLGTARAANALGVPLYCFPGSPGCDALLVAGQARPATSVDALMAHLLGADAPAAARLDGPLARVLAACAAPRDASSLAAALGAPLAFVLECLIDLELSRRVIRFPDGRYLALTGSVDQKG